MKIFKQFLSVALTIILIVVMMPFNNLMVSAETSGTVGSCRWSIKNNVLTISGEGMIPHYEEADNRKPWRHYDPYIEKIVIEKGVTAIGTHAFQFCTALTEVIIADTVTTIYSLAFDDCESLKSITIPDGVTQIMYNAFRGCGALENITLPDTLTYIGENVFGATAYKANEENWVDGVLYVGNYLIEGRESVVNCNVRPGTILIADSAFQRYSVSYPFSLESLILPDSLKYINYNAFEYAENLKTVKFGKNLKAIDQYAFKGCSSITEIVLPDSLTSLGDYAFTYCTSAKYLVIGKGLEKIPQGAFGNCEKLENIVIPKNLKEVVSTTFPHYFTSNTNVWYEGSDMSEIKNITNQKISKCNWHYNILIKNGHVYDNEEDLICNICNEERPPYILGDVSDDGYADLNDIVVLSQYVAGWQDITYNEKALDTNGSGAVDLNDIVHLAQYVAGWNVEIF